MKELRRNIILLPVILFIAVIFTLGLFGYSNRISDRLENSTQSTLFEITSQQQFSFDKEIESELISLQSISNSLTIIGYDEIGIVNYLNNIERYYNFQNLIVVSYDGIGITSKNKLTDISGTEYFKTAMAGETLISEPLISETDNSGVVVISTPIYEFDEITGVLVAEYPIDYLNDLLLPSFDGTGYAYVINNDGKIIAQNENEHILADENFYETLEQATYLDSYSYDSMVASIKADEKGRVKYILEGNKRIAEYQPLSQNGWTIFVAIPYDIIAEDANAILTEMSLFNIVIAVLSILIFIAIIIIRSFSERKIEKAAYYDDLTGLPNARKLKMIISDMIKRYPTKRFGIIKLDVVNFKVINEMFSFDIGNSVIRNIADVGSSIKNYNYHLARVGIDEFIAFADIEFIENIEETRDKLEAMFREKITFISKHQINFRYGRYYIPAGETDINSIIDNVTLAHSLSKGKNDNSFYDYDENIKTKIIKHTEITNKMHSALEKGEFKLFLQPKYDIKKEKLVGAEALVRWQESDGNIVFPIDFIPIFEQNGFIIELDKYMLSKTAKALKVGENSNYRKIKISVNFSRLHIQNEMFVDEIDEIVKAEGISNDLIEIELTESVIIDNEQPLSKLVNKLHEKGFALSMDDFGSGYSSLGLLKNLQFDVLKLDRSFFLNGDDISRGNMVIESIIDMARRLDITTIAEGVETKDQLDFLQDVGCDLAQGYYFAKPLPYDEFMKLWEENSSIT